VKDFRELPKLRDSWSHVYAERCRIDRQDKAIALHDENGVVAIPCATLTLLMLGPGTTITHAAINTLAQNGCMVVWCGEHGVRFYASGTGETRSSQALMRQARAWADPDMHMAVVIHMYEHRFGEPIPPGTSLQQIRGREGARVRTAYQAASLKTGVPWTGREYSRDSWKEADPVNRALSAANSCLYGVCHAALVTLGYSPALGFIHTGKALSFVYDVADLYKTQITVPVAFSVAASGSPDVEREARRLCRDSFVETRLLKTIVEDLDELFSYGSSEDVYSELVDGDDPALPGGLWDPDGAASGGTNYADGASPEEE